MFYHTEIKEIKGEIMKFRSAIVASLLLFSVNTIADTADAYIEAKQRISSILTHITVEPAYALKCGFKAGHTYTLAGTMKGYLGYEDETIQRRAIMYDCEGEDEATHQCGAITSDPNIIISDWNLTGSSELEDPTWTYKAADGTVIDRLATDFNVTFTIPDLDEGDGPWPSAGADSRLNGQQVVMRFFTYESTAAANSSGLSLLIGTRSESQYGLDMRRLQRWVTSDLNITDSECGAE